MAAYGEFGLAAVNWRILPRIRSCATRAADLVAAVQALA